MSHPISDMSATMTATPSDAHVMRVIGDCGRARASGFHRGAARLQKAFFKSLEIIVSFRSVFRLH